MNATTLCDRMIKKGSTVSDIVERTGLNRSTVYYRTKALKTGTKSNTSKPINPDTLDLGNTVSTMVYKRILEKLKNFGFNESEPQIQVLAIKELIAKHEEVIALLAA